MFMNHGRLIIALLFGIIASVNASTFRSVNNSSEHNFVYNTNVNNILNSVNTQQLDHTNIQSYNDMVHSVQNVKRVIDKRLGMREFDLTNFKNTEKDYEGLGPENNVENNQHKKKVYDVRNFAGIRDRNLKEVLVNHLDINYSDNPSGDNDEWHYISEIYGFENAKRINHEKGASRRIRSMFANISDNRNIFSNNGNTLKETNTINILTIKENSSGNVNNGSSIHSSAISDHNNKITFSVKNEYNRNNTPDKRSVITNNGNTFSAKSNADGNNIGDASSERRAHACGGFLTSDKGVISTPGFPEPFATPLHCTWVIVNSVPEQGHIVVYLTQLYAFTGLIFTEYGYYDEEYRVGARRVHEVTEENVTNVKWIEVSAPYLVIEFHMSSIKSGQHLRALDFLLDVYGFNITYEIRPIVNTDNPTDANFEKAIWKNNASVIDPASRCSVLECRYLGHCLANADFTKYSCVCFPGYSGPDCGEGPLCKSPNKYCENGATCKHLGSAAVTCKCTTGFEGDKCDIPVLNHTEKDCSEKNVEGRIKGSYCSVICPNSQNNDDLCTCRNGRAPEPDLFRYEVTFHLSNTTIFESGPGSQKFDPVKMAEGYLLQQLPTYLTASFRDLRVIYMRLGFHLVFHFFSSRNSSDEITSGLNRMASLGWLGTLPLVARQPNIKREPLIYIHSVKINRPSVDEGQEFILSCVSQGPSRSSFRWYKDGSFINVTMATRSMWTQLHPHTSHQNHSRGETYVYTAMLSIHQATPFDSGVYSCRVSDDLLKIKTCRDIVVKVKNKVKVRLEPQAQTVYKGQSLTIRCLSSGGSGLGSNLGYSWTQDGALFPNDVTGVMWEDLRPDGSVLKIQNAQRSHTYSCHVTNTGPTTSKSLFVTVVEDADNVCPTGYEYGPDGNTAPLIVWPLTAPGVVALSACPQGYTGQAVRLCEIHYSTKTADESNLEAKWKQADYSDCVADELEALRKDYHNLISGNIKTSPSEILTSITKYLYLRTSVKTHLAGEFVAAVQLLRGVLEYAHATGIYPAGAVNSGKILAEGLKSINAILKCDDGILGDQNIRQLQDLMLSHGRLFSKTTFNIMSPVSMKSHTASQNGTQELMKSQTMFQDGDQVSMTTQMDSIIKNRVKIRLSEIKVDFVKMEGISLHINLPASELGDPWKGDAISIHVKNEETHLKNSTICLMAVTYHNLTRMLPKLYSAHLEDGSDIEYIIVSRLSLIDFTTSTQSTTQVIKIRIVMSHLPNIEQNFNSRNSRRSTPNTKNYMERKVFERYRRKEKRSVDRNLEERFFRNPSIVNVQNPENWKRFCAVSASGASVDGTGWILDSCHLESEDVNNTICVCSKAGTYAVLYVNMKNNVPSLLLPFLPFILAVLFICLYILFSVVIFTLLAIAAYGKTREILERKGNEENTNIFFENVKKYGNNKKIFDQPGKMNTVSCRQSCTDLSSFTNKQLFENPQMTDEELLDFPVNNIIGHPCTDLEDEITKVHLFDNTLKENSGKIFYERSQNIGGHVHGSGEQLYESGNTIRQIFDERGNDQQLIANYENSIHLLNNPEKIRTELIHNSCKNTVDGGMLYDISSDNKITSEELYKTPCKKNTNKTNDRRYKSYGIIYYKLQCTLSSAFLGISLLYLLMKSNCNAQYISFVISLLLLLLLWSQVLCLVDSHARLSRAPAKFRRSARGLCIASSLLCASAGPMINTVLGSKENEWIPIIRTSSFIILTIGAILVTILYGVLFVLTLRRLRVFRNCKKNVIVTKSFAVLRRSGAVFCCCLAQTCSVLFFTQRPKNVASLALLSISCCALNIALVVCYIIKPEAPVDYKRFHKIWRKRSKNHNEQDTTKNQLNSLKKPEREIELEVVPQQVLCTDFQHTENVLSNSKSKSCDLVLESYPQSPRAYVSGELKATKCLYQHRSMC